MFKKKAEEKTIHKCCNHVGHNGRSCEVYHWWIDQHGKTVKITRGAFAGTIGRLGGLDYTRAEVKYRTGCHLHYTVRSIWVTYTDLQVVDVTEPECHDGCCGGDNVDCDDAEVCDESLSCCTFCKPGCGACGLGHSQCATCGTEPLSSRARVIAGTPESLWTRGLHRVNHCDVERARQIIQLRADGTYSIIKDTVNIPSWCPTDTVILLFDGGGCC